MSTVENQLRIALTNLVNYTDRQVCEHQEYEPVGAIWHRCCSCQKMWLRSEPPPQPNYPKELTEARAVLDATKPKFYLLKMNGRVVDLFYKPEDAEAARTRQMAKDALTFDSHPSVPGNPWEIEAIHAK